MWEIYAYHNSDALFGIFNAIAAIMGAGNYLGAVAATVFVGFCAAFFVYALQPHRAVGWHWLAGVVLICGVLFVPRVPVGILDKTGGSPMLVVNNVPFGLAALGSLSSTIGHTITELFETAFQTLPGPAALPGELSYQQNGLMFGSRLIQETRNLKFPDPNTFTDIVAFIGNCTAYDLADGTIDAGAFAQSGDVWSLMAFTNPARFTPVHTATGVTTMTCLSAYHDLNLRMPTQVDTLRDRLARKLNPTLPPAVAVTAVLSQIPQAYIRSQIVDASAAAADIIRQNALINAINDAGELGCQRSNDPACMMLATGRAQAVAAQNAAWIQGGKIAEQALPVVRNVAEAMIYATFPLVVPMMLVSAGRTTMMVLSGYAVALVSIQLWPPLFAILNYMASIYAQADQAAAAAVGSGPLKALSLQSASPVYSNAVAAQAVVAYLVIGIPLLAYAIANRMVNFGSAVMGGLSGLSSASVAANPAAAAAVGNANMGNITMDQRMVSPNASNPWVSREQDAFGNWWTHDAHGRSAVAVLKNEGITSETISVRYSKSDVEASERQVSVAASEAVSAGTAHATALRRGMDRVQQRLESHRSSAGQSLTGYEEVGRGYEDFRSEAKRISAVTGHTENHVANTLLQFGLESPGDKLLGFGVGAQIGRNYGISVTDDQKRILDQANQDTYKVTKAFADRLSRDESFLHALASEGRAGASLASELSETANRAETSERNYRDALTYSEGVRTIYEYGLTGSRDFLADPANSAAVLEHERAAQRFGPSRAAYAAHMGSILANFAREPAAITPGMALPAGFEEVRAKFERERQEAAVNPDLGDVKRRNDTTVRTEPLADPGRAPASGAPGRARMPAAPGRLPDGASGADVRTEVLKKGQGMPDANASVDAFYSKHGLERDKNGKLVIKNSLVVESMATAGEDIKTGTVEFSKAAVKFGRDLLSHKKKND